MVSEQFSSFTRNSITRALTVFLAITLLIAAGGVVYVAVAPLNQEDSFTEFYILGPEGEADGYPTNLNINESGEFIIGIINNEHQQQSYTVALVHENTVVDEETVQTDKGETWEMESSFTAEESGEIRLEVLLFRGTEVGSLDDPYRDLRLVVDVSE